MIGKKWIYLKKQKTKKWIYLERNILHRSQRVSVALEETYSAECGPWQKIRAASKCSVVSFYGMGNFIG